MRAVPNRHRIGRGQHLGDADAYRRDRREGDLLQEKGYLIMRFLAEEVGKHLERVLDAILRALSHQDARIRTELSMVFAC